MRTTTIGVLIGHWNERVLECVELLLMTEARDQQEGELNMIIKKNVLLDVLGSRDENCIGSTLI